MKRLVKVVFVLFLGALLLVPSPARSAQLAYLASNKGPVGLYLLDIASKKTTKLAEFNEAICDCQLSWSPNGKSILVWIDNGDKSRIFLANQGDDWSVNELKLDLRFPTFLSDEKLIGVRKSGKETRICRLYLDGKSDGRSSGINAETIEFVASGDGAKYACMTKFKDRVFLLCFATKNDQAICTATLARGPIESPCAMAIAPGGNKLLISYPMSASAASFDGKILNLATGKEAKAFSYNFEGEFTWESDNTLLCNKPGKQGETLCRFDLAKKKYTQIAPLKGQVYVMAYHQ